MYLYRTYKYRLCPSNDQNKMLVELVSTYNATYNYLLKHQANHFRKNKSLITPKIMIDHLSKTYSNTPFFEYRVASAFKLYSELKDKTQKKKVRYKNDFDTTVFLKRGFMFDESKHSIVLPSVGAIPFYLSRTLPSAPLSIEISLYNEEWYIKFLVRTQSRTNNNTKREIKYIGIDVGLKEFAFLSNNTVIPNPRFYKIMEEEISKEQRRLSNKKNGSENWKKQKKILAKKYTKMVNCRNDFLHKLSTEIVNEFDVIGIEKISIMSIMQKKHLRKSVLDVSWGTFIEMLKYKAEEKGKVIHEVDRFFPSSQICSNCGNRKIMPLHLRTYSCSNCGNKIDRDYNASINIEMKARDFYESRYKNYTGKYQIPHN